MKLLAKQELSAHSLSMALGVTPAAVRQHLDTLDALGLVARRKLVTRPSRPSYLYRLSSAGNRVFPKRYDLLLGLFVGVVLERHGEGAVADIVAAAAHRLAASVRDRFRQADARERWRLLIEWLEAELAWQADVVSEGSDVHRITIHQCPFQDVAREHPAICAVFFATLIRALYGDVPIEKAEAPAAPACCALLVGQRGR